MSSIIEGLSAGCIVEYLHNNQPVIAWLTEIQNQKARLLNVNKREVKLPIARILPWSGPVYPASSSRETVLSALAEHGGRREQICTDLDIMEIWSLAQGEIDRAPITWFADLVWGAWDEDRLAALGRAMLRAKTHFKFSPPDFEIFPEDVVEKRLEEMRRNEEKKRLVTEGNQFFRGLWSGRGRADGPGDEEISRRLKDILFSKIADPEADEDIPWQELTDGLPRDPHLPFLLARQWGIVSWHHNFHLDQAGYMCGNEWAEEFAGEIKEILASFPGKALQEEKTGFVSVDSESTADIDDAFAFFAQEDGFLLSLAFACPPYSWPFGSGLDQAVMNRASSIYLPEETCHMLPEELTALFSLEAGRSRPALVFDFRFSLEAELLDVRACFSWVRVEKNITYRAAEEMIVAEEDMRRAYELAEGLRSQRVDKGAVVIDQPEPETKLLASANEIEVRLCPTDAYPGAQVMVSEFMILANAAAASWAAERDIPLLYRTQDIALPEGSAGIWTDPVDVFQLVKCMGATVTDTVPRPHRGLRGSDKHGADLFLAQDRKAALDKTRAR
ncbi:MAG: RNB domain-containing ribonuclease [Desulfonatronovibrionaceae bacterium]